MMMLPFTRWASAIVLSFSLLLVVDASAQICGDATGDGQVTVSDGVNVLRAAAGLSSTCAEHAAACDADRSAAITVTDGVNVLRKSTGLPSSCDAAIATPTAKATPRPSSEAVTEACGSDCETALDVCGEEVFFETYESVQECSEECVGELQDFAVDAPDYDECIDAQVRYVDCCTDRHQCGDIPEGCEGLFNAASSACGGSFAGCPLIFF